jgi:hypothetical protein
MFVASENFVGRASVQSGAWRQRAEGCLLFAGPKRGCAAAPSISPKPSPKIFHLNKPFHFCLFGPHAEITMLSLSSAFENLQTSPFQITALKV